MRKRIGVISLLLSAISLCYGDSLCDGEDLSHKLSVGIDYVQIKEGENLGMVFSGPELRVNYFLEKGFRQIAIDYKAGISAAGLFSHGMTGYSIEFIPGEVGVDGIIYGDSNNKLNIGGVTGLKYHWQMYPDLHNSQLFGECEIPLDLRVEYNYKRFGLKWQNSIMGFVGSLPMHDPYFYSLSFSEFVFKPVQEIRCRSFGRYNHSQMSISWSPVKEDKHTFILSMEYFKLDRFKTLSYGLRWERRF